MINEYSLYTHQRLIQEISELFESNKRSKSLLEKAHKEFIKKYPKGFYFSWDINNALNETFNLMSSVKELSQNLPKLKSKKFDYLLTERFKELGNKARELYLYHRKSFHDNEDSENENSIRKIFPNNKAQLIYKYFYGIVSDYIHYMELLYPLGESLEKHSKMQTPFIQPLNSDTSYWITERSGQYYFDNIPVEVKSKRAKYMIIFSAVFSLKPKGGEIPYEKIIEQCSRMRLKTNKKKIQRALSGDKANFFKYIKSIKLSPIAGIPILRASPDGKFLEFNNKKV